MQTAIDQFRINISSVRNLGTIYKVLTKRTTGILDLTDILRAELVLAVSALDFFIHEVVRLGVLEAYNGPRMKTPSFLRFQVTLESALNGISSPKSHNWLEDQIRARHGYLSFQHPDRIAEAIRLISDVRLWDEVSRDLGIPTETIKQELMLIINRRNQIAHESDSDPSFPGKRWPISDALVDNSLDFIEKITEALFRIVK